MANKTQLVDALSEQLGDRTVAAQAVDALFDYIIRSVEQGERVTITGFGSFEPRARAARIARNPRTGEVVQVPKTTVPAFRAGTLFRDVVSGARELPKQAPARRAAATRTTAVSTTSRRLAAAKPAVTAAPVEAAPEKPAKKSKKAAKAAKAAPKAPKKAAAKTGPKASAKRAKKAKKTPGKKKK